jgi:hypothetical protein
MAVIRPKQYQTISEPVEVVRLTENNIEDMLTFLKGRGALNTAHRINSIQYGIGEGWVNVKPGQYIVIPEDGKWYVLDDLRGNLEDIPAPVEPAPTAKTTPKTEEKTETPAKKTTKPTTKEK